jgi:hypothetical protein
LVWQAIEKEARFICIIDVPSLVTLQQLQKPLEPEVRGIGVHSSTLPGQFLKYQAMALIEVGDQPFKAENFSIPIVAAILRDFSHRIFPSIGIPDALA